MKATIKLRLFTLLLAIIVMFCNIPAFAVSQEDFDFVSPTQKNISSESSTEEELALQLLDEEEMVEDVNLRDAFSKHYRKSNGEYYVVIYPEPVHYLKDDVWEEVDNTLVYHADSRKYSASSHQFAADFASSALTNELVTFSDGEYSMSWGIRFLKNQSDLEVMESPVIQIENNAIIARGTIAETDAVIHSSAEQTAFGKAVSEISYQNVYNEAVSLRYSVMYGRVEEDLILASAQALTSYELVFQTNGLTLSKQADNQIFFLNAEQEIVFKLDAPWMKDARSNVSSDFAVSVVQNGSCAVVTYTPNAKWLQDEDRVFPVLIDPSFTTRYYSSNYEDTYVYEGDSASTTRPTEDSLLVGNKSGIKHVAYLKVLNLPSWFDWSTATQFDLEFYVEGTSSPALSVSEVIEDWSAESITYANQPDSLLLEDNLVGSANGSYSKYVVDALANYYYWDDMSGFDSHMYSDFYGFKIEYTNQALTNNYTEICASEHSSYSRCPIIKISYSALQYPVLEDGAVYSFINSASDKYLTVDTGATSWSNVYQYQAAASTRQSFRLVADENGNGFAICTMETGDGYTQALTFDSDGIYAFGEFYPTNVELNTCPSGSYYELEQLWSIEFVTLYMVRIVPFQNSNYALTARGTENGSGSGYSTTSPGNIYLDEYTGANNQLWYVHTGGIGGQQIRNGAYNIKNVNSLTFSETALSVPYIACPATDHNTSVSFSSSNTSVATIDYTGEIDIKKAGITTITATVEDANEDFTYHELTLYVTLPNGTYYFNNVNNSYRIELGTGAMVENKRFQLWDSGTSDTSDLAQLYKIKYLGNGMYSIRSMLDNNMGWKCVNGELVNATLGYYDSNVIAGEKWCIDSNENGYYIRNYHGNFYTVTAPLTVNNGTELTLESYSATNTRQNWTIQKTNGQYHGVFIDNKINSLPVGESHDINARVYSTYTDVNGQHLYTWSVTNGTGSAMVNSNTGILTGVEAGSVTVKVTYRVNSATYFTASYGLTIIPVPNGTYFLCNGEYEKYMQIDNNASVSDDAFMELWDFDGESVQKWEIQYLENGYYKIISCASGKALTAPSDADDAITQATYTGAVNQQWGIVESDDMYHVSPRSNWSYYMAAGDGTIVSNGRNVEMRASQSDNKDEWYLLNIEGSQALVMGITNEGHDHHTVFGDIMPELYQLGCNDFRYIVTDSISRDTALGYMADAQIFVLRSHGNAGNESTFISLNNSGTSLLHSTHIYNFSTNRVIVDLSNCDLMLFVACKTAAHLTQSLPHAAVAAGANTAIGFKDSIGCTTANTWTQHFFDYYNQGFSADYSAREAASDCVNSNGIGSYLVVSESD